MAAPWLPDTCLTSQRAARPMAQIVDAWAEDWFADGAWHTLGGWDEAPEGASEQFALLRRARKMEIKGKPRAAIDLGLAILGERDREATTNHDAELLSGLGAAAIEDLDARIVSSFRDLEPHTNSAISASFPRVFSILIGTVGRAQLAIECSLADLVAMARSTYPTTGISAPLSSRTAARGEMAVSIAARLGTASISLKQLSDLEPGDLLLLDSKPGEPVELLVEDRLTSLPFAISESDDSCLLEFQG